MTERRRTKRALAGLLCGVAVLLAGCHTNEGRQAKMARRAITSLDSTRQQLVRADLEVNQALASMDQLAAEPRDLRQAYKVFTAEVADTSKQSQEARERADQMRDRWQEYIANWEKEADALSSEQLRAGATERRQTIRDNYSRVREVARETQSAYEPFLKQLREIQQALALDLTPGGVEAAKPAMETARQTGAQLKEQIDAFINEIDIVTAKRVAPPGGAESVAGTEP